MALGAYAFAARGKAQGSQPNGRLFRNVELCRGQVARASILVGFSTKKPSILKVPPFMESHISKIEKHVIEALKHARCMAFIQQN